MKVQFYFSNTKNCGGSCQSVYLATHTLGGGGGCNMADGEMYQCASPLSNLHWHSRVATFKFKYRFSFSNGDSSAMRIRLTFILKVLWASVSCMMTYQWMNVNICRWHIFDILFRKSWFKAACIWTMNREWSGTTLKKNRGKRHKKWLSGRGWHRRR